MRFPVFYLLLHCYLSLVAHAKEYEVGKEYREGQILEARIDDLHPTQFSIGQAEVDVRKTELKEILEDENKGKREEKLIEKATDVVIGPGGKLYIVNGHHHTRAFYELGEKKIFIKVDEDWSHLSEKEFQKRMENKDGERKRTRVYLKDEAGKERKFSELPKHIRDLSNNALRSVVFYLVRAGVLQKKKKSRFPFFGEFELVDWLREKGIKTEDSHGKSRIKEAVEESALLVSSAANQKEGLPGQIELTPRACRFRLKKVSGMP